MLGFFKILPGVVPIFAQPGQYIALAEAICCSGWGRNGAR